jgi:hypothetical protein
MTDCSWYTLRNEYVKHERNNLEVQQTDVLNVDKGGGNVILTAKLHVMPNPAICVHVQPHHVYSSVFKDKWPGEGGLSVGFVTGLRAG